MISDLKTTNFNDCDSLIKVRKITIAANSNLPTKVDFELTDRDLKTIDRKKNKLEKLQLSPELLADLRYYSLRQDAIFLSRQLVFTTYYVRESQKLPVIKTSFSLQGKISQEVSRQIFRNPQLLQELVSSHHWLIGQICDRISFKYQNRSSWLAWGLSLLIMLLIMPFLFYFLGINWLIKLIIAIGLCLLIRLGIQTLINQYLSSFILQQLLFGFFSKNTARRRLGSILLRYFG